MSAAIPPESRASMLAKHGRFVAAVIGGQAFAFRPFDAASLANLQTVIAKSPDQRIKLALNALEARCIFGAENYSASSNQYPLAFVGADGAPGVLDHLFAMARGQVEIEIVEGA